MLLLLINNYLSTKSGADTVPGEASGGSFSCHAGNLGFTFEGSFRFCCENFSSAEVSEILWKFVKILGYWEETFLRSSHALDWLLSQSEPLCCYQSVAAYSCFKPVKFVAENHTGHKIRAKIWSRKCRDSVFSETSKSEIRRWKSGMVTVKRSEFRKYQTKHFSWGLPRVVLFFQLLLSFPNFLLKRAFFRSWEGKARTCTFQ